MQTIQAKLCVEDLITGYLYLEDEDAPGTPVEISVHEDVHDWTNEKEATWLMEGDQIQVVPSYLVDYDHPNFDDGYPIPTPEIVF